MVYKIMWLREALLFLFRALRGHEVKRLSWGLYEITNLSHITIYLSL